MNNNDLGMHGKAKKRRFGKGQSLFELLFAVAIVSLIIIGVVSLSGVSVRNESFSQNQSLATSYGQETQEWLRMERDGGWVAFASRAGDPAKVWCLQGLSWPGSNGHCGSTDFITGTRFIREATLFLSSSDVITATVVVSWSDSSGAHDVRSDTYLTNWNR